MYFSVTFNVDKTFFFEITGYQQSIQTVIQLIKYVFL